MMKKIFIAPQLQIVKLCEKDVIMLSAIQNGRSMELDLGDVFLNNDLA